MLSKVPPPLALSAAGASASSGTVVFSNSNNVSFGQNGGTVTASATFAGLSAGNSTGGNTSGDTGLITGRLVLAGGNNITLSGSTNGGSMTLTISGANAGGAQTGISGIVVSNTTYTSGTVSFSNANGISFGSSAGQAITASYTVPVVTNSSWTVSDTATSATVGRLAFTAANGITMTLSTSNNGNHTVFASYTVPTVTNSSMTVSDAATSGTLARLAFTNLNGVTLSLSTGAGGSHTIVGSHNAITTGALSGDTSKYVQNWKLTGNTAGTTSSAQGTDLWLAGGNGVTVSGSSNTISLSVATNYQSQGAYLTTADLSANSSKYVQNWKLTGNTAGTTSSAQGTDFWLAGGNNITVSGSSNTISFSVGAYITTAALSGDTSKYVQNWKLTGNTSGTTSSAQGTDLWFSGGNSITVSGNSNTVVFSVGAYLTTADLSANSSKYVQAWELTGNTAGTTSSLQGTKFYLSAGNNITLSGNSNTIVISAPNLGAGAFSGGASTGGNTAGSTGITGTRLVFVGTNMVSLSQSTDANGGTLSFNATQTNQAGSLYGLGNTTGTSSGTYDARTLSINVSGALSVAASNSGFNLSVPATSSLSATGIVSISVNGSTISIGAATFNAYALNSTTQNSSSNLDLRSVSFNATGYGQSIGLSNGSIVFSQAPHQSYYSNFQLWDNTTAISQSSGSSMFVQPFILPEPISVGYIRLLASFNDSAVGTAGTTVANTSFSCERYSTFAVQVLSQGTGASSRSLTHVTSSSGGMTGRTIYSAGGTGATYTITIQKSYPVSGTTSSYSTSYAVSSASIVISSNSNTLFTGLHFLDIPFGVSLSPGAWWMAFGHSTSSASQSSNISFVGTAAMPVLLAGVSQSNLSVPVFGGASSASDHQLQKGLGVFTSNASLQTTGGMGINSISQVASNPVVPFQLIREA